MALTKFGFIVTGAGLDPSRHRSEMTSDCFQMVAIGVSEASQGLAVAKQLVGEGVQLLELCGGFGPRWTAQIIRAIEEQIPVGSVGYGPEAIGPMHKIFCE